MDRKVAFKTLGCRLNQFETDALVTDFYKAGYSIVPFSGQADVFIVNTCTVTNTSDHKSRNIINQAAGKNGSRLLVVTGCMAGSQKEWLENRKDITWVIENDRKSSVFTLVDSHFKGEIVHPSDLKQNLFDFSPVEKGFHTRSMIKIQDGCNNFCTFCIVPAVRGRASSRPVNDILENIRKVIDLGYKEIVLTGVNISRYRYENNSFEDLVGKILATEGDFRLRISSIEPEGFGDRFIELFAHPKMCPHLHLCLQSGSDRILMQMRRQYALKQYLSIVEKFKKQYPLFNFTTDIIVGFPGETETEFNETCKVVRETGFSHVHTFKYSVRKGTRAERMAGHIPEQVKHVRSEMIRQIGETNKLNYRKQFMGRKQVLLIEKTFKDTSSGYGQHYIPAEVDTPSVKNTFVHVLITGIREGNDPVLTGQCI